MRNHRNIARCLAVVSSVIWCGGCAYFNTYYNGKRLYDQAQGRIERQFPDTALAGSGEAANYQKAIDKFATVVRNHPTSRWSQNSLYHMGLSYYYTREFQKAERKFQEIWEYYPDSRFAPRSRLNAAVINWKLGDYDRAATILTGLRGHSERRVQEKAAYLDALILQSRGSVDQAAFAWERFLFNFYRGDLATDARLNYARCLIQTDRLDNAIRELEIVAGKRIKKQYRHQVWFLLGQAYAKAGRNRDAARIFNRILSQQPDNAIAAQTEYHLAAVAVRTDEPPAAMERYLAVAKKYPSTQASAQSYFAMGALMEREQRPDTALALYKKAKNEFGTGPLAEAALRKASDIALLLSYRKESSQATREQGAVLQFLMAEHYLFGLNLPDSAAAVYQRLASEYADLPLAPKALLAAGWTLERDQRDTAAANDFYRRVIAAYPATRYANGARDRLGLPLDPAVADSESVIEFKAVPAPAPARADTSRIEPAQQQPDRDKPENTENPEPPPPEGGNPENKVIPGPDEMQKQIDER
ncbi:MAG: tetratricopeptide repeat protein [Candidatus Edwardsbacteria bacterium]|nr:tetratricopeptide repeat protein [Candidatus Edwardsbacteria bacterium]